MPPVSYCVMCGNQFFGSELRCENCRAMVAERMRREELENKMRAIAPDLYAALRASTELLRGILFDRAVTTMECTNQIAANEAVLGGGK